MNLGAVRDLRDLAHGACEASSRCQKETLSLYLVDDEQPQGPPETLMRSSGSGRRGACAASALLGGVQLVELADAVVCWSCLSAERIQHTCSQGSVSGWDFVSDGCTAGGVARTPPAVSLLGSRGKVSFRGARPHFGLILHEPG
jgi:hypothetical protein